MPVSEALRAPGPAEAKAIGGKGAKGLRLEPDELAAWDAQRDRVQRRIIDARIDQDSTGSLRRLLLSTGDKRLVHFERMAKEHSYWGAKLVERPDGSCTVVGRNMLGRMWEEKRSQLGAAHSPSRAARDATRDEADADPCELPALKQHRSER